jgi:hypothetical protein
MDSQDNLVNMIYILVIYYGDDVKRWNYVLQL